MPLTANDFPGLDANTASELAKQHNFMVDLPTGTGPTVQPPSAAPAAALSVSSGSPAAPATPQVTAQEQIEQLQRARADGKISDYQWRELQPQLTALIAEAANGLGDPMQEQLDAAMAPARSYDYKFPERPMTDDQLSFDTEMRDALADFGVPRFAGDVLAQEVNRTFSQLKDAPPAKVEQHMLSASSALRRMWGASFEENLTLVDDYVATAASKYPVVNELLEKPAQVFGSAMLMDMLLTLARHRQNRATRGAASAPGGKSVADLVKLFNR